jgi:hypothetical protein
LTDPKAALGLPGNGWVMWDAKKSKYVLYPSTETWFIPRDATPGRGFWARLGSSPSVPCGTIVRQNVEAKIHLYAGWNLIGQPFANPVNWDLAAIHVEVGGTRVALRDAAGIVSNYAWGWDSVNARYYLVAATGAQYAVAVMQPWEAYWIVAGRECDLVLPPP